MIPAHAKALLAKRRAGLRPDGSLAIFCGWQWRKHWTFDRYPWRIVIQNDTDPADLDLAICAGLDCLLIANKQDRMDAVAMAVFHVEPERLVGVCEESKAITIYSPAP